MHKIVSHYFCPGAVSNLQITRSELSFVSIGAKTENKPKLQPVLQSVCLHSAYVSEQCLIMERDYVDKKSVLSYLGPMKSTTPDSSAGRRAM